VNLPAGKAHFGAKPFLVPLGMFMHQQRQLEPLD
jgi:hypothetical protein